MLKYLTFFVCMSIMWKKILDLLYGLNHLGRVTEGLELEHTRLGKLIDALHEKSSLRDRTDKLMQQRLDALEHDRRI